MSIFKAYDVRGIYNKDFTEKEAYFIGYYLVKYLNLNELKIAHDKRESYEVLTTYLIKGILDAGAKVDYLGLSSTPNFYYSLFNGVQSGVMVTASHNPKEYNGFKVMHNLESFDSRNGLYELEKLIKQDKDKRGFYYNRINEELTGKTLIQFLQENNLKYNSTLNEYSEFLVGKYNEILNEEEIKILSKLNFSLDFSSGVSSLANVKAMESLPFNINLINHIVDGTFPIHSPDPKKAKNFIKSQENLGEFTAVFDGDGDRIIFYDENKDPILVDYTIAGYIDYFSKTHEGKNFVCDLRASKTISDFNNNGLSVELIRVGRAFYKEYMDKHECRFGAELSGHLFFKEFHNLDNPDIALIHMLKIYAMNLIKNPKIKFSEIFDKYKNYYKIEEMNIKVSDADFTIEKLKEKFFKNIVSQIDGVSFNFNDYWFNIRKSNTEPIIRINFEGEKKEKTLRKYNELLEFIKE